VIKTFLKRFSGFQIFSGNRSFPEVDYGNPVANPGVNILFFPESLRGADDQRFYGIDNPADVVGKPSG